MPEIKWIDFQNLITCDELEEYFGNRAYNHSSFFHYTRLSIADNIIVNKQFWLSNVGGANDRLDVGQFGDEAESIFFLCLSTGMHENLPMWYMYPGLNGKGARFSFTKAQVRKLIEDGKYILYQKENNGKEWKPQLNEDVRMELTENDFDYEFRDVLYVPLLKNEGESGTAAKTTRTSRTAEIKYTTLCNYKMPEGELQKYIDNHTGFSKKLIWSYERETRLV